MWYRIWDQLQNSEIPPAAKDMAQWEAEFNDLMQSQREDLGFASDMESAWKNSINEEATRRFNDDGIPILEPYQFGELQLAIRYVLIPCSLS